MILECLNPIGDFIKLPPEKQTDPIFGQEYYAIFSDFLPAHQDNILKISNDPMTMPI